MSADGESKAPGPSLRVAAEARLAHGHPSDVWERPSGELLHELHVHQIELEMQNEALRKLQVELEESRDRYVDLYEFAPVGYLTLGEKGLISEINLTGVTLLGRDRGQLLTTSLRALVIADDQGRWIRHLMYLNEQPRKTTIELSLQRGDGTVFQAQLDCVSSPSGVRVSLTDITPRKQAEAEIHQLAYYDALTKLPNRRLLQDRLDQAILATARSGVHGAMFFIDIDHFKSLNDSRGHDAGDLLLVEVAQRLRNTVRENDTVARQGGDEFVVLMEALGATSSEAAIVGEQMGHKLREALAAPFNLHGYEYHCKTSIGVGLFQAHDTVEALFKHADLALYQAKASGRDRLRFFDPAMQDALEQRIQLESALRKAVSLGQLRLYYQLQMDVSNRLVGAEALLRWQHPQRGSVLPDAFIPLAEDTGLILPLGSWVINAACAQIKAWESNPLTRELQISVNVSARQFRQPDFVAQVQSALQVSAINPARLKLELTESMLLDDVPDTIAKMWAIKALGVRFSLDDFGTGYSSLAYLARLPLDQLKIDKSFVRNVPGVKNDETVVRAIITLGLGLNLNVIAEGVETESQRAFLMALGCQEYQGYLFGKPLPLADFEVHLAHA